MTVAEWLFEAKRKIDGLDAELILLRVLSNAGFGGGLDRSWLAAHGDFVMSAALVSEAEEMLTRRAAGEPLAYILGSREFYGRDFRVSSAVLIPRPETEGLIELVREHCPGGRVLEVGTGSGCIAVTLALLGYEVTATDVSAEALAVAEENARRFGVLGAGSGLGSGLDLGSGSGGKVRFYQGDLLEALPMKGGTGGDDVRGEGTGSGFTANAAGWQFDVLVANLPYVDAGWEWLDREALGHEPSLALYAEDGGLALYKKLVRQMRDFALVNGVMVARYAVFEADLCQHEELRRFAEDGGLRFVKAEGFGMVFEVSF